MAWTRIVMGFLSRAIRSPICVPSHAFQPQEFSFSFPGADLKFRGRKSVRAAPRIVRRFALPIEDLCALRDSPTFPNSFLLPDVSVEITL